MNQQIDEQQRYFTIDQAARYSGLTESSIRTRIFRGQIRAERIGRRSLIERHALERLIEESRQS